MKTISTDIIPQHMYHVRRRRGNKGIWLIAHNFFYQIDETADAIWLLCNGTMTIADIAWKLSIEKKLDLSKALALTISSLEYFRSMGLIEYIVSRTDL
jgi:hypothetical protein